MNDHLRVHDVRVLLPEILDALPYPEGEVLTRLYWEGATYRTIAADLGLRFPSLVARIERRAMRRIRELVEGE